jgi:uncharacterized protein
MDEEIINKIKLLAKNANELFDFEKVIVFGSYSTGKNKIDSDIDVAFIVNKTYENHFILSAKLFEIVDKIDYRIEPLIVNRHTDKSGFVDNILKNGIEITYS